MKPILLTHERSLANTRFPRTRHRRRDGAERRRNVGLVIVVITALAYTLLLATFGVDLGVPPDWAAKGRQG